MVQIIVLHMAVSHMQVILKVKEVFIIRRVMTPHSHRIGKEIVLIKKPMAKVRKKLLRLSR